MDKMINRRDAMNAFERGETYHSDMIADILSDLPSAEPTDCVLTMFGKCSYAETGCSDCLVKDKIRVALEGRPTGHWLVTDGFPHHVYCSECYKTYVPNASFEAWADGSMPRKYCPNCGARMESV